jgi:hypothetical protein
VVKSIKSGVLFELTSSEVGEVSGDELHGKNKKDK